MTSTSNESHRVGRRIRAHQVRVIGEHGSQLGVLLTQDALALADVAGLQLVEVNPKAVPPVCRIMDYGKFKYDAAKREREANASRKTVELKEVKFGPKTQDHDFETKVRHIRRFLDDGHNVKLTVQFRGRELMHPETGKTILERACREVADIASVQQGARLEGSRMHAVLVPLKNRRMN